MMNQSSLSLQCWRLCIELVALAEFSDATYVRQLWDVHLKHVWDTTTAAAGAVGGGSQESAAAAALEAAALETEQLGEQFFPDDVRWRNTPLDLHPIVSLVLNF